MKLKQNNGGSNVNERFGADRSARVRFFSPFLSRVFNEGTLRGSSSISGRRVALFLNRNDDRVNISRTRPVILNRRKEKLGRV